MLQRFLLHTNAGVRDRELQRSIFSRGGNSNFSLLGKLRRVAQEIQKNLFELIAIRLERRQIGSYISDDPHAPVFEQRLDGSRRHIDNILDSEGIGAHLHFAGVDLSEVEQPVYQVE